MIDHTHSPDVSVVITTHAWDRLGAFRDAVRSIEAQTYDGIELVCPIDADANMADAARMIIDAEATVDYHPQETGLAEARNRGARTASGDIYAFLDDDCVASETWVERLVGAYRDDAIAAGGPAYPEWPDDSTRPWHIPQGFDWLVGGGPYYDDEKEVRNTYGCNISFRARVFDEIGGFDEALGKDSSLDQGEETDLCKRMLREFGEGVRYVPDADVRHRVFKEQLSIRHLLRRAYAQGKTKREIGLDDEETSFIADTLKSMFSQRPTQSLAALSYTAATGIGYIRGGERPSRATHATNSTEDG